MKTSRALITLTCLAALLAPARAGDPQKPRDAGEAQDLPGRWEPLDGASRGGLWPGFEARFGPGWALYADPVTGSPSMLAGPGIDAGGPIEADDAGIARARALLEQLADVLGVDDPSAFTLERAVAYPNAHGQKMVTINFKQQHRGLDVRHQATGGTRDHLAMVKLHFNGTLGRLVLLGSDAARSRRSAPRSPPRPARCPRPTSARTSPCAARGASSPARRRSRSTSPRSSAPPSSTRTPASWSRPATTSSTWT
jgi:hypothetical protein